MFALSVVIDIDICFLGATPYPAIDLDETFVERLKRGYRLEKPDYATKPVYDVMYQCWATVPENRPNFTELVESFGSMLSASVKEVSICNVKG